MQMMTDRRVNVKNLKWQKSDEDKKLAMQKKKEKRNQSKKLKKLMKKRLIIRNLSFQVTEEKLKTIFSKFGEVLEVNIPLNKDGKKRGFAFLRYKDTKSQLEAMKALNFKKIEGRPIAIDFAVDKTTFQSRMNANSPSKSSNAVTESRIQSELENSECEDFKPKIKEEIVSKGDSDSGDDNENEKDKQIKIFLKEFDADKEVDDRSDEYSDESSEDEDDDENESQHSQESESISSKVGHKKQSDDVSEGKTVFIRNISFKNTEEDLLEVMQEYGETDYCLLCVDPLTDFPRGTAFVKFKAKESADKLIGESSKEPGILLDGRKLLCTYAISRGEVSKICYQSTKVKDKRNLRLLKCGIIMQDSKEAEGVSQTDMAKRTQLEMMKKRKLKNVNFFVSDVRLAVHNLPKNVVDKDLKVLFTKAGGKGAVVKEARVMRDFKKTDAQGHPVSRGFGFVSFAEHEHALKALTELNNNPLIFTSHKRPIVEFSVENKVALLAQERKKERIQMINKKKMKEKLAPDESRQRQYLQKANSSDKKRKNKRKNSPNKKLKKNVTSEQLSAEVQTSKSKKKQKKHNKNKNKRNLPNKQENASLSQLRHKYKEKLLNKLQ